MTIEKKIKDSRPDSWYVAEYVNGACKRFGDKSVTIYTKSDKTGKRDYVAVECRVRCTPTGGEEFVDPHHLNMSEEEIKEQYERIAPNAVQSELRRLTDITNGIIRNAGV